MGAIEMIMITVVVIGFFVIVSVLASLYQKCGPNEAMVISGGGKEPTIIVGGGAVVLPMIQQKDILSLEVMPIEVRSNAPMITRNGVPIFVHGVAQI